MFIEPITPKEYELKHDELFDMMSNFAAKADSPLSEIELLDRLHASIPSELAFGIYSDEGYLVGFVLCEIKRFDAQKTLVVVAVYNPVGGDAWDNGWRTLEDVAQEKQCTLIACESRFGGKWKAYFERKLKKLGFEPAYVTYKKEV